MSATTTTQNFRRFSRGAPASEMAGFYEENGFLVVEDAFSADEVALLNHDAAKICRGDYGSCPGLIPAAPGESDDDVLRRHLCIHFPHKFSKVMADAAAHPAFVEVLTAIIGPNVKC